MKFSIVTPNFNGMPFLPRCCASVADQRDGVIEVEHIIVDGASKDGTVSWLTDHCDQMGFSWISELDEGMYDALNKGFSRAAGDYLAWLNADEQYMPQVLKQVSAIFEKYPSCDIVCSDSLVVDSENRLLCMRRGEPLRAIYIVSEGMHLLTCSIFYRRKLWSQGLRFNASLKSVGENDFFLKCLRAGGRVRYSNIITAAFSQTGSNLGASSLSKQELDLFRSKQQKWYMFPVVRRMLVRVRQIEKMYRGAYRKIPSVHYKLYDSSSLSERTTYVSRNPTYKWPASSV